MSFAQPTWLVAALPLLAGAAAALRAADRRRERALAALVYRELLPSLTGALSRRRRTLRRGLVLAALGLALVALARPRIGFTWREARRRGIDVLVAVDVSRSMRARDVLPDRLGRAKLAVTDLVERLGGARLGLIAFAGSAFLQCPLTLDEDGFRRTLDALEPGIVPRGGTDLAAAIRAAIRAYRAEENGYKLLVLLSDGEDLGGEALAAADEAARAGVRIFAIGIGSPEGDLIPLDRGGSFVKDERGRIVKSRLDEATLRAVAERTGGRYERLGRGDEGIERIYRSALAPIPERELEAHLRRVPRERFQWPLAAAILLLAVEPLVGERRREPRPGRRRRWLGRSAAAAALALALAPSPAAAADGVALYREGRYAEALEAFRSLAGEAAADPRVQFDLGAAAYKAGRVDTAAEAFAKALATDDPELRQKAFYDLGNAQFRLGQRSLPADPARAAAAWKRAIAAYDEALRLDAKDEDARFNREVVRRALEELARRRPPQPSPAPSPDRSPSASPRPSPGASPRPSAGGSPRPSPRPSSGRGEARPSPRPSPAGSSGAPLPTPGASSSGNEAAASPRRTPGAKGPRAARTPSGLGAREAADLLDSLRQGERMLPALVEEGSHADEESGRDW